MTADQTPPSPEPGPDAGIDDIQADIEHTRKELGETIGALSAKADVTGQGAAESRRHQGPHHRKGIRDKRCRRREGPCRAVRGARRRHRQHRLGQTWCADRGADRGSGNPRDQRGGMAPSPMIQHQRERTATSGPPVPKQVGSSAARRSWLNRLLVAIGGLLAGVIVSRLRRPRTSDPASALRATFADQSLLRGGSTPPRAQSPNQSRPLMGRRTPTISSKPESPTDLSQARRSCMTAQDRA